ncbi:outer membrane protein assembly factor BamE [Mesosutterella sp. OilRF-GAM-744-9]|uniref:Outer membrane protein assembly factor BamE n=1 Tax=Mesosutterella porci TaxID=2915351 RepID=A0ABS9MPH9_9BURK|nr:twin-arginine translocation signal domain-containing protein [Mesosutterella sp. oilRF-744-WT-GAM-9]MCG5030244.1 outer membrane protein assembly factor BamE [Mesosutterella sp. oilRF-744-WT-GAM-9]MCI6529566.1 outer membrane protein assembly factor BamE [Mesosutterella sp.]
MKRRTLLKAAAAGAAALVLGGCAHPQLIAKGVSEADIVAKLGKPHARTVLPDGTVRLTYSWQPMGQAVWWMFLDSSGRYFKLEQALVEDNFPMIKPGMTRAQVYELLGPCAEEYKFPALKQTSLMYRYEDYSRAPMALWVDLDLTGHVVSWTTSTDPWLDRPLPML